MTPTSERRVKRFVDNFIRSEYVQNWTAEHESDFINDPDRANRCYEAATFGGCGSTHREIIWDWRRSFNAFMNKRPKCKIQDLFADGVHQYFDEVEEYHVEQGTIDLQIG